MEAALHKTVNRPAPAQPAPAAFVRAPAGVAPRQSASSSRTLESPYITRFAGSITQMQGRAATLAGAREADGTHLYRTGDGQVVALPEGMTAEHVPPI